MKDETFRPSIREEFAGRIKRILLAAATLPLALPAAWAFYISFIPAHSASYYIAEIDTTVALRFYWLWDWKNDNDGRYLTVHSRPGTIIHQTCGYDWAHHARTSLYLTADNRVVVLGPENGCDAIFDPASPNVSTKIDISAEVSETWLYLGAFDLTPETYGPTLRFYPASKQQECLHRSGSSERLSANSLRQSAWEPCKKPEALNK
jgi:hypothetical protein